MEPIGILEYFKNDEKGKANVLFRCKSSYSSRPNIENSAT